LNKVINDPLAWSICLNKVINDPLAWSICLNKVINGPLAWSIYFLKKMADHLASIYGTEKDKVNCSFFMKIGACRHGEKCSKKHVRPTFSQVVLLPNLYQNPSLMGSKMTPSELQQDFDLFYEDIFMECAKYGEIIEMNVCDNVGDHLVGNVYIRYKYEDDASKADLDLNNRFYAGRPLYAELSPVSDFREACCRQYESSQCTRGGMCNFMHLKPVSKDVEEDLYHAQQASIKILNPRPEEAEREARLRLSGKQYGRVGMTTSARGFGQSESRVRPFSGGGGFRERDRDRDRERDWGGRDNSFSRNSGQRGSRRDYGQSRYY
jgi:splicing factor U2AF subunit